MNEFTIREISPNDQELILLISKWYLDEWKVSPGVTIHRLSEYSKDDILFHLVLEKDTMPIATGGLHLNVGLFKTYPEFKKTEPWVALLYTLPEYRGGGLGKILLREIEKRSLELGYRKIFLFTNTAESLYQREGWNTIQRLIYKEKDTVVMEKEI